MNLLALALFLHISPLLSFLDFVIRLLPIDFLKTKWRIDKLAFAERTIEN
jgi:hypothetical protein